MNARTDHNENYLVLDDIMADGYGIVSRRVMRAEFITNNAKALYSYLCSFAGRGNAAFPSTETIRRELNLCKDAFYAARKELSSYGIIQVETERTRNGARTLYRLCTDATVADDAVDVHLKTEETRAAKAAKADKARASAGKKDAKAPESARSEKPAPHELDDDGGKAQICNTPEGFEQLRAISLKKVRPEEYADTVQAYNDAVKAGHHPDQILKAYGRYIKRYKTEHPGTIRFAKQLKAYLQQPDGLAFDAPAPKKRLAVIERSPEEIERERIRIAKEEAGQDLLANDERYQSLSDEYYRLINEAFRCTSTKDQDGFEANKSAAEKVLTEMEAMQEERMRKMEGGR